MGAAILSGVIETVGRSSASGWVRIEDVWSTQHDLPVIELRRGKELVAAGILGALRKELTKDGFSGHSFRIELSPALQSELLSGALSVVCVGGAETVELKKVAPLDLAVRINSQSNDSLVVSKRFLTPRSRSILSQQQGDSALPARVRRQAAVITYANDANAWFPYFLSYYGRLFGVENIFVVTPVPEAFSDFGLGGVWSVKGFPFDDAARASMMSSIANGCRNYYVWSIVCDVDEIIEPAPWLGVNLREYLSTCEDSVLYTRGLDVLQSAAEPDFDFRLRTCEQRSMAIPNTALYKPHLARVEVNYSGGFHFCSRLPEAGSLRGDLVTYHLKWACSSIRAEVQSSVMATSYSDVAIESYCRNSADPRGSHPSLTLSSGELIRLDHPLMSQFSDESLGALCWAPERGLYVGDFKVAPFLVKISK